MSDFNFTPTPSQQALIDRIKRGEPLLVVRHRRYGWSAMLRALTAKTKPKVENEKVTNGNA